jgi:hypothetical protein|tara:strand:- start:161 stop:355 length:195 start_codon:yes stop_codon:yes gene_type:complete
MEAKKWFESKTLWVNLLAGIGAITGAIGIDIGLTPEMQLSVVTAIMAVVNVVLRVKTKQPVALK